jgi:hypothetical protein
VTDGPLLREDGSEWLPGGELIYLRTAGLLFAEERHRYERDKPLRSQLFIYERSSRTWERVLWAEESAGRREFQYRIVGTGLAYPFGLAEFPETVHAPVSVYTGESDRTRLGLLDIIETGKVVVGEKRDMVDGSSCWVVEGTKGLGYVDDWKAYLDPGMNFCPRRIERTGNAGKDLVTYEDYTQMNNGMWFPKRIRYLRENTGKDGKTERIMHLFTIEEAAAGIPISSPMGNRQMTVVPESISLEVPAGAKAVNMDIVR